MINELIFDFSQLELTIQNAKLLSTSFCNEVKDSSRICVQDFVPNLGKGNFLMPIYLSWVKLVEGQNIFESTSISDERKKIIRTALKQSEKLGIRYEILNPVNFKSFESFFEFYKNFNEEMGYDQHLLMNYFQRRDPRKMFLINILDAESHYLGARLIYLYKKRIATEYRAIQRTKLIKEGFDTVCEKIFYDLAVQSGVSFMGRGKELNLRGLGNRKLGVMLNKLKYGYRPYVLRQIPRVYLDMNFLNERDFDIVFFISLENKPLFAKEDEVFTYNFIVGEKTSLLQEVLSAVKKLNLRADFYDKDFNSLSLDNLIN